MILIITSNDENKQKSIKNYHKPKDKSSTE